jgi:hypothetical protein
MFSFVENYNISNKKAPVKLMTRALSFIEGKKDSVL